MRNVSHTKTQINWADVKSRLAQSQAAMEEALLNRSGTDTVLQQRTLELAQRRSTKQIQVGFCSLVFAVANERYALDLADLCEVSAFTGLTSVPSGPEELLGVINSRGEIRAVLSLRRMLGLNDSGDDKSTVGYLVMIHRGSLIVGIKADQVEGISFVLTESLTLPEEAFKEAGRFIHGITSDHVIVLNTDALLAHPIFGVTL